MQIPEETADSDQGSEKAWLSDNALPNFDADNLQMKSRLRGQWGILTSQTTYLGDIQVYKKAGSFAVLLRTPENYIMLPAQAFSGATFTNNDISISSNDQFSTLCATAETGRYIKINTKRRTANRGARIDAVHVYNTEVPEKQENTDLVENDWQLAASRKGQRHETVEQKKKNATLQRVDDDYYLHFTTGGMVGGNVKNEESLNDFKEKYFSGRDPAPYVNKLVSLITSEKIHPYRECDKKYAFEEPLAQSDSLDYLFQRADQCEQFPRIGIWAFHADEGEQEFFNSLDQNQRDAVNNFLEHAVRNKPIRITSGQQCPPAMRDVTDEHISAWAADKIARNQKSAIKLLSSALGSLGKSTLSHDTIENARAKSTMLKNIDREMSLPFSDEERAIHHGFISSSKNFIHTPPSIQACLKDELAQTQSEIKNAWRNAPNSEEFLSAENTPFYTFTHSNDWTTIRATPTTSNDTPLPSRDIPSTDIPSIAERLSTSLEKRIQKFLQGYGDQEQSDIKEHLLSMIDKAKNGNLLTENHAEQLKQQASKSAKRERGDGFPSHDTLIESTYNSPEAEHKDKKPRLRE